MTLQLYLALFVVFHAITLCNSENTYIALVPQTIRPGLVSFVHINVLDGIGVEHLTTHLLDMGDGTKIIAKSHSTLHLPGLARIPLMIPANISSLRNYSIEVKGDGPIVFKNFTSVQVNEKSSIIFIQTDKATYRPGTLVQFRAFGIYPTMQPVLTPMDIYITDPKRNRLKQWLRVLPPFGVFEGSFRLTKITNIGTWIIHVSQLGQSEEKRFVVEEYVLPKFEVTVKLPSFMLTTDEYFRGTVEAKYTFGKPVRGNVTLTIKTPTGKEIIKKFPITGIARFRLLMKEVITSMFGGYITVKADVMETITGISLSGSDSVQIYQTPEKMEFLRAAPNVFKPRLVYRTVLFVTQRDGTPLQDPGSVNVTITYTTLTPWPHLTLARRTGFPISTHQTVTLSSKMYEIPPNGMIIVQFNHDGNLVPRKATHVNIQANYRKAYAGLHLRRAYSKYNSYVQLQLLTWKPVVGGNTRFRMVSTRRISSFIFQVISKGTILRLGKIHMRGKRRRRIFHLIFPALAAPRCQVLMYYIHRGEIVADSVSFSVEGAFRNRVSISFEKNESKPGDLNSVMLGTDCNSSVSVLAIDKSVILLRSGNDITRNDVLRELQTFDTTIFNPWGWGWRFPIPIGGVDASSVFMNAGVKVMTDALLYKHIFPIVRFRGLANGVLATFERAGSAAVSTPPKLAEPTRTRTRFPETLLFHTQLTNCSGLATLPFTVPDQITTWVASSFSMNLKSGLGVVARTSNLTVFQKFFIRVNPTPSAIRGEIVIKQVDIFNYEDRDLEVTVELVKGDFIFVDNDGNPINPGGSGNWIKTVLVQKDSVGAVFFPIIPTIIGKIRFHVIARSTVAADAVIREIDIKPEGIQRRYTISILKDMSSTKVQNVTITFPPRVVQGSAYIIVSVIGDIMGSTVAGLADLLRMSYGCGEQNMLNFSPNVFITKYLKATNRLTPQLEAKTKKFLEDGLQRELKYRRNDGSFSAFGNNDKKGSLWLTSFVLKSFAQAKDTVFVDPTIMKDAIKFILRSQSADGSFNESGIVLHKAMQGGSSANRRSLAAYVVIALQEAKDQGFITQGTVANEAIQKGADYIAAGVPGDIQTLYELAIVTYALTVAGHPKAQEAMNLLERESKIEDGLKFWEIPSDQLDSLLPFKAWTPPKRQARALDIEVTSYALLTYVRNNDTTNGIMTLRWMGTQRNDRGGFVSTQDTVLAIQAFAEFAQLVFAPSFNIITRVWDSVSNSFDHTFNINNDNALVLQQQEVPGTVRNLNVRASGQGMCLTEITVFYNVEEDLMEPAYFLNVSLSDETINGFTVHTCFRWLRGGSSTMALLEIGIPTGMEGILSTVDKTDLPEIKEVEEGFRKVDIYMDSVSSVAKCTSMKVRRIELIARHKAVPVVLTDYYEPSNQVTVFYTSSILHNSTIVEVCGTEGCIEVRKR